MAGTATDLGTIDQMELEAVTDQAAQGESEQRSLLASQLELNVIVMAVDRADQ